LIVKDKRKILRLQDYINAQTSTEDKSEDEKNAFYDNVRRLYDNYPKHDIKIVIGDMNAQIGREELYQLTAGNQGFHQEIDDNGRILVNFAASRNMVIGSTMFEHKNIVTCRSIVR
jgi:hypothetical protein